jgi:hypothetical protein
MSPTVNTLAERNLLKPKPKVVSEPTSRKSCAPNAMYAPARTANKNILEMGSLHLLIPVSIHFSAISLGDKKFV